MKKTVVVGAIAVCLLLGGSVSAFAASGMEFPFAKDQNLQKGTFQADIEGRMAEFEARAAEMKEKADASMTAYEQYGLTYNEDKGGYCYDGKLAGLLVDPQGRGITYLNKNGEVHIKAIRDGNGELIGLAELSEDEYNEVITELDGMEADMQKHMDEMRQKMEERMNESKTLFQSGEFNPSAFKERMEKTRESMQEQMSQLRAEMERRFNASKEQN